MKKLFKRKPSKPFHIYGDHGILINADCIKKSGMPCIKKNSVDLVLCDLPYGTTGLGWDLLIPPDKLWKQWKRVLKKNCTVVLFASQPFTNTMIDSNKEWFKYEWIWVKNRATGFVHAKNKPQKNHENIIVFSGGTTVHKGQSKDRMIYNPQGIKRINKKVSNHGHKSDGRETTGMHKGAFLDTPQKGKFGRKTDGLKEGEYLQEYTNYPMSVLYYNKDIVEVKHPTQKPVKLCDYLIQTYSNEGAVVLDNTCGYCSTGVSAIRTNRKFICIEYDKGWFKKSHNRIKKTLKKNKSRNWFDK